MKTAEARTAHNFPAERSIRMKNSLKKKIKAFFLGFMALLCMIVFLTGASSSVHAEEEVQTARPSVNGALHVEGTQLTDASGQPVQLRGVSTHGLTWYPEFVSENLFRQVSEDWNGNLVRLAMYASVYCNEDREESYSLMKKGIDAAVKADMYVLVDWHMLEKGNPNDEIDGAMEFFGRITSEYAGCKNLIFEICNEPNGETDWSDVIDYANRVIPVIRANMPESVIVVGTPEYDRNLGGAVLRPLAFDNIMYVLHFYTATHYEGLRGELQAAVDAGLPVFISECGISEASGDGKIDFRSAAQWFAYLYEKKISYAVWSLSDKDESSAFFKPGFDPRGKIEDSDLTLTGKWIRELIRGKDPRMIPAESAVVEKDSFGRIKTWINNSLGERGTKAVSSWLLFAGIAAIIVALTSLAQKRYQGSRKTKRLTYDDIVLNAGNHKQKGKKRTLAKLSLIVSAFCTLIYLCWRIVWSIPVEAGVIAITGNVLLLAVEILGFVESMILFRNLLGMKEHPLPEIPDDAWPDVDIFIATYNEPTDLLRRTVNGCKHMKYPDPSKVHIWVCDDNRRPQMHELADEMGVGYFDRPDNQGAKAGNLNHALGLTSAPYIVTFDADMIPKSDFLLKTIPYFVDAEISERKYPSPQRLHLGLLQTPQCFYDPDVFQHALYSEKRAPNEQDFFYRTIEPAKTSTNSVIYGGSNTVLSRKALEDIGGFFTGSITEDFATGLLIESAGYVSLGLPEPLASGQTPHTFHEHIQQRTRWARGVIVTGKKLKIWSRKELTAAQKISYWSSVIYWYSPIKNLIYMLSPLMFAAFAVPVFKCNWLELLVFWLPMFIMQDLSLRLNSGNSISTKWSGIYETSVMPHLLIPIIKESLGITLSSFKVTDKSKKKEKRERDLRSMVPFLILIAVSLLGIARIISIMEWPQIISYVILLFWIVRNLYYLIMAIFLIDGRDSDTEAVRVADAELVKVIKDGETYEGVTTMMTEHNLTVYLDEEGDPGLGSHVSVSVFRDNGTVVNLKGVVTGVNESRRTSAKTFTIEILGFGESDLEYLQLLYDRIPTLPQSLQKDFGLIPHLWQNIAHRVARTRK